MAHIEKYKAHSIGHMLAHYRRDESCFERDNINRSRTNLNYTIGYRQDKDGRLYVTKVNYTPSWETVEKRLNAIDKQAAEEGRRKTRKDAVLMADMVITLPKDVPEKDAVKFFLSAYLYCGKKFGGRENMMGGYVHMDETTPHMHVPFTPIVDGRFCYKQMCDRQFYRTFHKGLTDYLEKRLGYRPEIELGESRKAEKVLSQVPQKDIDTARAAILDPAKREAGQLISEAKEEAKLVISKARKEASKAEEEALDAKREAVKAEKRRVKAESGIHDLEDRLEWLRLDLEDAELDNRSLEEDAELELNRVQGGGFFRTAEDPRYLFDSLRQDRERCERAVEKLRDKRRDLEEEGERAAKGVRQLEKRVADALVARLDADAIRPVHIGTIITNRQLESFTDKHQADRITAAIDRAAAHLSEARKRLAPRVEEYRTAVQKRLESFISAAKAWFDGGETDEKPVFKVPRADEELKKYCNVEIVEIKMKAKKRAENAAVKYGLQPKKKAHGPHTLSGHAGKRSTSNYRTRSAPSQSISRTQTRATGRNGHSGR